MDDAHLERTAVFLQALLAFSPTDRTVAFVRPTEASTDLEAALICARRRSPECQRRRAEDRAIRNRVAERVANDSYRAPAALDARQRAFSPGGDGHRWLIETVGASAETDPSSVLAEVATGGTIPNPFGGGLARTALIHVAAGPDPPLGSDLGYRGRALVDVEDLDPSDLIFQGCALAPVRELYDCLRGEPGSLVCNDPLVHPADARVVVPMEGPIRSERRDGAVEEAPVRSIVEPGCVLARATWRMPGRLTASFSESQSSIEAMVVPLDPSISELVGHGVLRVGAAVDGTSLEPVHRPEEERVEFELPRLEPGPHRVTAVMESAREGDTALRGEWTFVTPETRDLGVLRAGRGLACVPGAWSDVRGSERLEVVERSDETCIYAPWWADDDDIRASIVLESDDRLLWLSATVAGDPSFQWFWLALAFLAFSALWVAARPRYPTHIVFESQAGYRNSSTWVAKPIPDETELSELDVRLRGAKATLRRIRQTLRIAAPSPVVLRLPGGRVVADDGGTVPAGTTVVDGGLRYGLVTARHADAIASGERALRFPSGTALERALTQREAAHARRGWHRFVRGFGWVLAWATVTTLGAAVPFTAAVTVPEASQRLPFVLLAVGTVLAVAAGMRVTGMTSRLRR